VLGLEAGAGAGRPAYRDAAGLGACVSRFFPTQRRPDCWPAARSMSDDTNLTEAARRAD